MRKKNAPAKPATPARRKASAELRCSAWLADLEAAHTTLQHLRVEARNDDRRSDAQHYADTQWLIRGAMKVERRKSANT